MKTLDDLFKDSSSLLWRDRLDRGDLLILEREQLPAVSSLWKDVPETDEVTKEFMVLAVPLQEQKDEVVIAVVSWSVFQAALDEAQRLFGVAGMKTGYAYLLASDGDTLIGHKIHPYIGKRLAKDFGLQKVVDAARISGNPLQSFVQYVLLGKPKFASIIRFSMPAIDPSLKWYVAVCLNDEDAFSLVKQVFPFFVLAPIATLMIVLIVQYFVSRNLRLSVLRFAEIAKEVAEGKEQLTAEPETVDEISSALHQVLLLLKAKSNFSAIDNPYVAGNPIRTREMFYGRHEDLKWIVHHLSLSTNSMIGIFGQRRIGKTSLLHHIHSSDFSAKIVTIFIDTQEMLPEIVSDCSFYQFIARKIIEQAGHAHRSPSESANNLAEVIDEVRSTIKPKKLVLLFDELENLEYKFATNSLSHDIVLFLAGLLEGRESLSFVISGSDQKHLDSNHWRVLSPKITARRIGMLSTREARLLVTSPLRQLGVVVGESISQSVLRLSGCHPYYTQLICRVLVDELNESKKYIVTPEHLQRVVAVVLDSPPAPLTYVWKSFESSMFRIVCSAYAFALADEREFMQPNDVLDVFPRQSSPLVEDRVKFRAAVEQLRAEDWLEANSRGAYRFRIDLCRLWIKRYHSVWQVTDEILQRRESA